MPDINNEERYSNRMLDMRFESQTREIKEHMELLTKPILTQTTKTNGRVTKNEEDIVKMKTWRGWMTGGMSVVMIILPIAVALLTWMCLQIVNLHTDIKTAVDESFDQRIESVTNN